MMGTQIFRLKFENFIYQKLKFSEGYVRTLRTLYGYATELMPGFLAGCWTLAIHFCYRHLAIFLAVGSKREHAPYNLLCCKMDADPKKVQSLSTKEHCSNFLCCDCCNHDCHCT